MASPVPSDVETAEEKARREKLIAAVAAAATAVVVAEIDRQGVRAILAPASISVDAITGAIVRYMVVSASIAHRAVHRYARVLVTDNDKDPTDEDLVARLTEIEDKYQVAFATKAAYRIARRVFAGVKYEQQRQQKRWDVDTAEGRDNIARYVRAAYVLSVEAATKREEKLFDMRMEGIRQRITETVEEMRIKADSPQGAYWLLDPSRKTHTEGCLAMANKAWAWEVLSVISPSIMHYGCGCKLISLQVASAAQYPRYNRILTSIPAVASQEIIR